MQTTQSGRVNNARLIDDDARQIVNQLDNVCIGLSDLQANPALGNHPAIQNDLHVYEGAIKRAADFLAKLREGQPR